MTDAAGKQTQAGQASLGIAHLVKQYANADRPVLNDISFDVPHGKVFVIVGPSGSGKSTLLRTIAGLEPIQGGTISLNGEVIETGKPGTESAGRSKRSSELRTRVGMVFQSYDLFPNKTVLGNITLAPTLVQKRDKGEVEQEAIRLLERVGLADRKDSWPHELSGGLRQRVMIAMAMVCKPKLLIADEPTTALDVTIEAQILRLMKELRDETGMSVLIITHNMGVVAEICDYVYVMYAGKIMEQAETFELFDHTMHPYTKGLLDSIPRIGQNAERLHTIPGVVPNLLHLSQGCPFSNRCEYATDQCRTEKAQLHPVAPDHQVRCFRCEEEHQ